LDLDRDRDLGVGDLDLGVGDRDLLTDGLLERLLLTDGDLDALFLTDGDLLLLLGLLLLRTLRRFPPLLLRLRCLRRGGERDLDLLLRGRLGGDRLLRLGGERLLRLPPPFP